MSLIPRLFKARKVFIIHTINATDPEFHSIYRFGHRLSQMGGRYSMIFGWFSVSIGLCIKQSKVIRLNSKISLLGTNMNVMIIGTTKFFIKDYSGRNVCFLWLDQIIQAVIIYKSKNKNAWVFRLQAFCQVYAVTSLII